MYKNKKKILLLTISFAFINFIYFNNEYKVNSTKKIVIKDIGYMDIPSPKKEETSTSKPYLNCRGIFLHDEQEIVANKVLEFAIDKDLTWTMLAIAWQESSFGMKRLNANGGASGVMQILPSTAKGIAKKRNENYKEILPMLVYDDHLNLEYSLEVINYFIKVNKFNGEIKWKNVWAGYYAGHNYHLGYNYANSIFNKIKKLKTKCKIHTNPI